MTQSIQQSCSATSGCDLVLGWTVHLARLYPTKLACSIAMIVGVTFVGYWAVGWLGSIAVLLLMIATLADFLFPMTFELTSEGATCKMLLKSASISWTDVKRCYLDDFGVKLSPLGRRSRLEAFRGVYLRFGDNQDEIIEAVKTLRTSQ